MTVPVRYTILPCDPAAHLFEVAVIVSRPAKKGQQFVLPAWIPGSYMIREFSKHIVEIRAESGGKTVELVR